MKLRHISIWQDLGWEEVRPVLEAQGPLRLSEIPIWQHLGWEEARPMIEALRFCGPYGSENKTLERFLNPNLVAEFGHLSTEKEGGEREKRDGVVSM